MVAIHWPVYLTYSWRLLLTNASWSSLLLITFKAEDITT